MNKVTMAFSFELATELSDEQLQKVRTEMSDYLRHVQKEIQDTLDADGWCIPVMQLDGWEINDEGWIPEN